MFLVHRNPFNILKYRNVESMKQILDRAMWEILLNEYSEANFLQSWAWGEFHRRLAHPVYRVSVKNGIAQAIVEPAKRARYLTVPGGPLVHSWNRVSLTPIILELKRIAQDERCSFIRIRPQVLYNPSSRLTLSAFGFRSSPMHLHAEVTRVLDLTKSDEQLLSEMRKSTRYEIRQAQKLGVTVEQSTDESLIDHFVTLQEETAKREHFVPFSKEYLLGQFRAFHRREGAQLFLVRKGPGPEGPGPLESISMAFVIFYRGEAIYHYAASSEKARHIPASVAIQWAIIQEAKKRGCTTYNLWGDVPDDQLGRHRFSGPSLFKRGFGGELVSHLPAQDLPLSWKYWISWTIERVRKATRRL